MLASEQENTAMLRVAKNVRTQTQHTANGPQSCTRNEQHTMITSVLKHLPVVEELSSIFENYTKSCSTRI